MNVRAYDEVDPDDVQRLTSVAFGWKLLPEQVRILRSRDPRYLEEYALYAVEHGKPFAQVVLMKMPVRLATGVEEVGGLQGVCSHPARWGAGIARRLIEHVHDRFRETGLRISTLTTSRNIRGHSVYRGLGYVELAPFYCASRRVDKRPRRPAGVRLRPAALRDVPAIQRLFEEATRDSLGWTVRVPEALPGTAAWRPESFARYRILVRDGRPVGYLRARPGDDVLFEEVIAPRWADFRAAVALMERRAVGGLATTTWITCRKDRERFRDLGYRVDGPIPDATMAVSLRRGLPTRDLPRLFGGTSGRFAQYPTEDF